MTHYSADENPNQTNLDNRIPVYRRAWHLLDLMVKRLLVWLNTGTYRHENMA